MDLFRAEGVLDPTLVAAKKLLFLGTGSLGSLAVANLAYPWREIVLVDPDNLQPENLERHLLGKKCLGQPKVEGITEWLVDKGVDTLITAHVASAEEVLPLHTDADLAVVSIDNQFSLWAIDEWCAEHNIPALYGGIYAKGTGGEVIVITDSNDICYQCASHLMGRKLNRGSVTNYGLGTITYVGSEPQAVPILHWAINSTACDMAGFALEILSESNPPPQVLVRANSSWEPFIRLAGGEVRTVLTGYILMQTDIGLVPNIRLGKTEKGYQLEGKHTVFHLSLTRWDKCNHHG